MPRPGWSRCTWADGLTYVNIEVHHDPTRFGWDGAEPADVAGVYADHYLDMTETSRAGLARALAVIAASAGAPVLVRCHVGRDRTGVLAALTLALLGVPDDRIADDHSLSAEGERRYNTWLAATRPGDPLPAPHLVATPREAMLLTLAGLRERYGGVAGWARAAGVPAEVPAALRAALLVSSA